MLGSPVDIAIVGVVILVIFGPKGPTGGWHLPGKPETWEPNRNSPKDPFPKPDHDHFTK